MEEGKKEMRYYVKTLFHGWREVNEERFNSWCNNIRSGAVAMTTEQRESFIKEHTRIEG